MAVSDCIFGSLPAAVIKTDVDNLRPGDILVTDTMDSYIITHVAREYVVFAGVEKGRVFWSQPFPTEQLKESFNAEQLDYFKHRAQVTKALDMLWDNAKITDEAAEEKAE